MTDINQLKRLLEFYDQNLRGAADPQAASAHQIGGYSYHSQGENRPGLAWAQEQMRGPDTPQMTLADFAGLFNGGGGGSAGPRERPAFVRSGYQQQPNPFMARVQSLQETPDNPTGNDAQSYIAELMGRKRPSYSGAY